MENIIYKITNLLKKVFNKITLRNYYKKKYYDMFIDFIESEYGPEVVSARRITFKDETVFKGPVIFFVKEAIVMKGNINFHHSMILVPGSRSSKN